MTIIMRDLCGHLFPNTLYRACLLFCLSLSLGACQGGTKQGDTGHKAMPEDTLQTPTQPEVIASQIEAQQGEEAKTQGEVDMSLYFSEDIDTMHLKLTEWLGYRGKLKCILERVYEAKSNAKGEVLKGKLLNKTETVIDDWEAYQNQYYDEDSIETTNVLGYMRYIGEQAHAKSQGKEQTDDKEPKHPEAYDRYDKRGYIIESVYPHAYDEGVMCRAVYTNDRQGNPIRSLVYERQGKQPYKPKYIFERSFTYFRKP